MADIYIGLSNSYIENGSFQAAIEILGNAYAEIGEDSLRARQEYLYENIVIATKNQYYYGDLDKQYIYDTKGNVIKEISYNEAGYVTETVEHEYDSKNRVLKDIWYYGQDSLSDWTDYSYDANGRLIAQNGFDISGNPTWNCEFKYDNNNNLTEKLYLYDGIVQSYCVLGYDSNGNCISESWGSGENYAALTDSQMEYEYDSYGNRIKEIYLSGYAVYKYIVYEYNANNLVTRAKWYNSGGYLDATYPYYYDFFDNVTKDNYFDYTYEYQYIGDK